MASKNIGALKHDADPEPPPHVDQLGIGLFLRATVRGSSAMPQIGQVPGSAGRSRDASGQVYSVVLGSGAAFRAPAPCRISGRRPV